MATTALRDKPITLTFNSRAVVRFEAGGETMVEFLNSLRPGCANHRPFAEGCEACTAAAPITSFTSAARMFWACSLASRPVDPIEEFLGAFQRYSFSSFLAEVRPEDYRQMLEAVVAAIGESGTAVKPTREQEAAA